MDQTPCVLLEALKQFIDQPENVEQGNHEEQLESMSQKSAARAKQMLSKLCKRKAKKAKKIVAVEHEVTQTPPRVLLAAPTLSVVGGPTTTTLPPYAAMVLWASEAKLENDKLSVYLQNLKALTKGQDYFSRDVVYAVDALRAILDLQGSLSAILQAGDAMELRDVLDVRFKVSTANDQRIVEFTLGDMQVADGGELNGTLHNVQLIFGNLPMPPK